MSEILVKMDTQTKLFEVSIDGKAVGDVYGVSLYRSGYYDDDSDADKASVCISTRTKNEEEDYWVGQSICASEGHSGKPLVAAGAEKHPEFEEFVVAASTPPVRTAIAAFLQGSRKSRK